MTFDLSQPDHETRRQIEVKFCLAFVFQGVMKLLCVPLPAPQA